MSHCYVADETTYKAMNECREEVYTTVISLQFYIEVFYNQLRLINVSESILFVEGATVSCK